jgi:DNA repair exonuclease SbcCD ATPase subunit
MMKTKEMGQLKVQFEERLQANEQRNSEFEQQLQDELERMKADLDEAQQLLKESQEEIGRLRQENKQLISIKGHLEQEKELDILTIKKEVLTQKERQLKEMQGEMNRQMEELGVQYRSEKLSLEESHQQALKLKEETIHELRKEIQEASQRLHQFESKPFTINTEVQTEELPEAIELRHWNDYIKKMAIKLSEWMDFERPPLDHPALLETIMDNVRLFIHTTKESMKQREVQLLHLKEQVRHLKEATEEGSLLSDMKKQHFLELEKVIQEAKREKEMLILAHEQEIQSLKVQEHQLTPSLTVESLKKMYPVQVAELEATIEYACKSNFEQDRESYERQLSQQKANHAQKLKEIQEKYQKEVELITFRLKEQCSKAYDGAVAKLKGEYKKSEEALLERHSQELDLLKRQNSSTHELEELTRKCTEYQVSFTTSDNKAMVSSLEDTLSRTRITHQQELHRLQDSHSNILATMKKKYISTLQSIRDDVVKGKQKSLERLESEWKKRKQKIDQEWAQRYDCSSGSWN